jgi:adenylate kinase family enzyme
MKLAILGNSGAGKSTLARLAAMQSQCSLLDLDSIYWSPNEIAVARPTELVLRDLRVFVAAQRDWIVEGCYGDLIRALFEFQPELWLLGPGEEVCLERCRSRPWEPHKYASKAEQDSKLPFLLDWVRAYYSRQGEMSAQGHREVFDAYSGVKRVLTTAALPSAFT